MFFLPLCPLLKQAQGGAVMNEGLIFGFDVFVLAINESIVVAAIGMRFKVNIVRLFCASLWQVSIEWQSSTERIHTYIIPAIFIGKGVFDMQIAVLKRSDAYKLWYAGPMQFGTRIRYLIFFCRNSSSILYPNI